MHDHRRGHAIVVRECRTPGDGGLGQRHLHGIDGQLHGSSHHPIPARMRCATAVAPAGRGGLCRRAAVAVRAPPNGNTS